MTLKYTYKTLVKWNDTILKFLAHIRKIFNFEKKKFWKLFFSKISLALVFSRIDKNIKNEVKLSVGVLWGSNIHIKL
jgi:hypothetical protein